MPPRKKKANPNMPPLAFVQSPLHQTMPHNGFREISDTVTAKSVPVDDLENLWVSPQFTKCQATQVLRSRKNKKTFTKLRSKSEGSNPLDHLRLEANSKFPPLQFIQHSDEGAILKQIDGDLHGNRSLHEDVSVNTTMAEQLGMNQEHFNSVSSTAQQDIASSRGTQFCACNNNNMCCDVSIPKQGEEKDVAGSNSECGDVNEVVRHFEVDDEVAGQCLTCGLSLKSAMYNITNNDMQNGKIKIGKKAFRHSTPIDSASISEGFHFCTPPRHHSSSQGDETLVTDTPECDYGLGFRQRQMKTFRHPCNINDR